MAGTGNRDVQLVITAKNQATAAIDAVAEALKVLGQTQQGVGESAAKTEGLLAELTAELGRLAAQAQGLQALGVAAGALDKAAAAVERLQNQLSRTQGENAALGESYNQAAQATATLATAAERAKVALADQKQKLLDLREAQALLNGQVRAGEQAFQRARTAVVGATAPNEILKGAYRDQLGALQALYTQQEKGAQALVLQRQSVAAASTAYRDLTAQVRLSAANEGTLQAASVKTGAAVLKAQEALASANVELGAISGLAAGAAAALGGVEVSQEAVGAAALQTAADIAKVNAALQAQAGVSASGATGRSAGPAAGAVASYRAQVQAVQQAREAYQQAASAATKLGAEIARAEAPTAQLSRDFLLARAASQQAQQAFYTQAQALAALRGQTQGTFADFSRNASVFSRMGQTAAGSGVAFRELAGQFPALIGEIERTAAASNSLGATIKRLAQSLFEVPPAANEAAGGLNRVAESGRGSLNIFTRMRNEILALTTAYIGFYGAINAVGGVINTLQTLQGAQQRLAVAFEGDQRRVATEIGFVREQSERLGFSFNTLVQEYTRIAIAGKEAGFSAEGTRKIFLAFAEAARVAGLSQQQLNSAFLGLREGMERGTINARNFNLEIGQNVPGAVQAMAAAVDKTTAKFTQLQKASGGVAANEYTLTRFADILHDKFAAELPAAVQTLNAELGRFQAHMQEAELAVADGGFAAGLTRALKGLDEEFKDGSGDSFFRDIGAALGSLAGIVPLVVSHFGVLIDAVKLFIGLKLAQTFAGIIRSGTLFGVSLAAAGADVDRLVAAMGRLGGESGVIAVALARLRIAIAATGQQLGTLTLQTALLAAREAVAAVASGAMSVAIIGLRAVMTAAAATARAMWIAIGGFPGLIITGLTFIVSSLLGDWIAKLGQTNDLMADHEATMEKVRQAYADANGEASKLRDTLKDLSSVQLEIETKKQGESLAKTRDAASQQLLQPELHSGSPQFASQTTEKLREVVVAFHNGEISAANFKRQVNALAEADPQFDRGIIGEMLKLADAAHGTEQAIIENQAALRELKGTATDADRALLGLKTSAEKVNGAFDPSALDRYNTALLNLQKLIPNLAKIAELQERIKKAQDDFDSGKLDLQGPLASKDPKVRAQAETALAAITKARDDAINQLTAIAKLDEAQEGGGQRFVDTGRKFIGRRQDREPDRNVLESLFKAAGENVDPEMVKWCAAFVNAVLATNGVKGTGSLAARSFADFGTSVPNNQAEPGDIVIIKGAGKNPEAIGHVGFFTGFGANGRVNVLGGDQQGGRVSEESFPASSVVGFRRPPGPAEEVKLENRAQTSVEEFNRYVTGLVTAIKAETAGLQTSPRDAFIASKLTEVQKRVDESGPTPENPNAPKLTFTPAQRADLTTAAGNEFDAKQQQDEAKKVADAQLEYNKLLKGDAQTLSREEYIRDEALKDGINLLDAQGEAYAAIKSKIYDLQAGQRAYNDVIGKGDQIKDLGKLLTQAFKDGDVAQQHLIAAQIIEIKKAIEDALPAARAFAAALGDSKMVANLDNVQVALGRVKVGIIDAQDVNKDLADGLVGAIDKSADAVARWAQGFGNAKTALLAVRNAFLSFASDFLRQMADMILKQLLLNALSKSPIGGFIAKTTNSLAGAGAATGLTAAGTTVATTISTSFVAAGTTVAGQISAAMLAGGAGGGGGGGGLSFLSGLGGGGGGGGGGLLSSLFGSIGGAGAGAGDGLASLVDQASSFVPGLIHAGGIVGRPGGMSRRTSPLAFLDAIRMHSGGIPGLSSDEYGTILQRNEEVLTEADPRHAFNGGGRGGAGGRSVQPSVKIVNAIDHGQMLSEAMKTDVGERAILNHVRGNQRAWRAAMGSA